MKNSKIDNEPLVTINILSYNRKDELRHTLQKVYKQDYMNIEVIVVDNASLDGTALMVETEFPNVILLKSKQNIGIAGWNMGFEIAKGEYVMVLDDDSYPDENSIRIGMKVLEGDPAVGVVAFEVFNIRIGKSETIDFNKRPFFFIGCGAMLKRQVIKEVGFYNDNYFLYYHELDYSARCYDKGYEIMYLPNVKVFHRQSLSSRGEKLQDPFKSEHRYYFYFISYSIFLIQNFECRYTILFLMKWFLNRLLISLRYLYFTAFVRGIVYIITNIRFILKKRKPLETEIQEFYNHGNMPLIDPEFF